MNKGIRFTDEFKQDAERWFGLSEQFLGVS
jgi:hypothetical protein